MKIRSLKKIKSSIAVAVLIFQLITGCLGNMLFIEVSAVPSPPVDSDVTKIEVGDDYEDSLLSKDDVNWYKFTIEKNGYINIDFKREVWGETDNYWKLTVYEFDENLKEISSPGFDGNHKVSSTEDIGLAAGSYYISIERYPYNFSDKVYTFKVNFKASENWEKGLNETFQTADDVNINEDYSGSLSSKDDCDWYKFSVDSVGYVTIDFKREVFYDTDNYWKSTVYKMDESIEEMAEYKYDGNHSLSKSPDIGLSKGDYYIKIERYPYNFSSNTYTIKINYNETDYWEKEFNNTFQTASYVELNTDYQGSLYSVEDIDWYKFDVPENGCVSVDFEREVLNSDSKYWDMTIFKYDESLQEMASWEYDGNYLKSSTAETGLAPGSYYIKIEKYSYYNYAGSTYTIRVNYNASEYWEKEFNNEFKNATVIENNTHFSGSMYSSDDQDWYEFNLKQDSEVKIDFITGLIGDPDRHWVLKLYQCTDTIDEINDWHISGESSVTSIPEMKLGAGKYYIKTECYSYYNYSPATYQIIVNDGNAEKPEPIVTTAGTASSDVTTATTITSSNTGDINGDGEITLKDAVLIRRYIAGGWNVEINKNAADIDGDGEITLKDAVLIRRYIAGGWNIIIK